MKKCRKMDTDVYSKRSKDDLNEKSCWNQIFRNSFQIPLRFTPKVQLIQHSEVYAININKDKKLSVKFKEIIDAVKYSLYK
jgi:hypothetical protein